MRRKQRDNRAFRPKKTGIGTGLTGGFPDNTGEIQAIYRDGSAFSRPPHGEERASARVSNHGQLAPLLARDPILPRPWPILRDARPAAALLRMRQIEGRASSG